MYKNNSYIYHNFSKRFSISKNIFSANNKISKLQKVKLFKEFKIFSKKKQSKYLIFFFFTFVLKNKKKIYNNFFLKSIYKIFKETKLSFTNNFLNFTLPFITLKKISAFKLSNKFLLNFKNITYDFRINYLFGYKLNFLTLFNYKLYFIFNYCLKNLFFFNLYQLNV